MCDNQPPDDVKEYRERYDAMLDAEAAAAEAQVSFSCWPLVWKLLDCIFFL